MHRDAFLAVKRLRPEKVQVVYEVGSLIINGTVRPIFNDARTYMGIDVVPGPGVDAVADAAIYAPPMTPDCCVCCEVLEHTPLAADIVAQLGTLVAPGGAVIVTCAGPGRGPHSAVDGGALRDGEYYANIAPDTLRLWLEACGLSHVQIVEGIGDPRARTGHGCGDVYGVGYKVVH